MVVETATRQMTYQQAVNEALRIAMREDPTVVLMGEDIAGGAMVDHLINDDAWGAPMGVTKGLVQEFWRNRVLDTPITEAAASPTPADAKGLLLSAIRDDDFVMFFENKVLYGTKGDVPEGDEGIPLGVADIKREGDDVTIVAISRMVHQALAAADALSAEGIDVEVIDPRTLSPLDDETILSSVAKTHRLVIVDEDNPRCSAATDIAAMVADRGFDTLDAPIKRVSAPHTPVPFSPPLEQFYVPSSDRIVDAVREIV